MMNFRTSTSAVVPTGADSVSGTRPALPSNHAYVTEEPTMEPEGGPDRAGVDAVLVPWRSRVTCWFDLSGSGVIQTVEDN